MTAGLPVAPGLSANRSSAWPPLESRHGETFSHYARFRSASPSGNGSVTDGWVSST